MDSFKYLSRNFIGICLSTFLYFGSFYLLMPVLPIFVDYLGGTTSQIGLVTGVFTVSSVLFRPYFGKLTCLYGPKKFLLSGAALFALPFIAYGFVSSIELLYPLRLFHGLAHGVYLAASSAYIANLAPDHRRGEVIGVFGVMNVTAMALCPALGSFIISTTNNFLILFSCGVVMALIALLAISIIDDQHTTNPDNCEVSIKTVFFRKPVLVASLTLCTSASAYGAIITFLPVYAPIKGIYSIGLFFTAYAIFTLLSRVFAGKMSDIYGRYKVILPFTCLIIIATGLLTVMDSVFIMILVAAFFGLGFGAFMPTLNAYIVDEVSTVERGSALAVFTSFMDVGISLGAIVFGVIGEFFGYATMFGTAACFVVLGLIIFAIGGRTDAKASS